MVREYWRSALSGLEKLLMMVGLLLLLAYGVARVHSAISSRTAIRQFWRSQSVSTTSNPDSTVRQGSAIPDFRLWSPKRIEEYQSSLISGTAVPLGVLKISSIGLEVPVLEGTDDLTLNRGAGHIDGTPNPGEDGNIGIAGHRDGFFRGLKDVHPGNYFDLYTEKGNFRYVVDEIVIVPPEDLSVLAPRSKASVTLVTCYPFYFVGSAPLRYIVHASIVDSSALKTSGPQNSLVQEEAGREKK